MWIFNKDGFISVVQHEADPDLLRVRSRKREHLVKLLERFVDHPDAAIYDLPEADYRWHADVPRMQFALYLAEQVENLDYTSHVKEAIAGDDREFYDALLDVWADLQVKPTYEIRRFYQDLDKRPETVVRGLTLAQAQAHCRREDTHGDGWFDGYEREADEPVLFDEEDLAEFRAAQSNPPTLVFAWECPFCGAAVEHGDRGSRVECRKCGEQFTAGAE